VTSTRTLTAAILVVGALTAVLVGWFGSGWRAVEREQRTMLDTARAQSSADAAQLAAELVAELEHLRANESQRPSFHYQNLFHDERGASQGWSVVPSPLATGPTEPLVAAHFQIDGQGAVSSPTVNPAAPENNAPQASRDLALLAELSGLRTTLVEPADPVQVAMARGSPAPPVSLAKDNAPPPEPAPAPAGDKPVKIASKPRPKEADVDQKTAAVDPFDGNDKLAYAKKRRPIKAVPEPEPRVEQVDPDVYAQNKSSNEIFVNSRASTGGGSSFGSWSGGSLSNVEQGGGMHQQAQVPVQQQQQQAPALPAPTPHEDPVPASARAALDEPPVEQQAAAPRPRPRPRPAAANPAPQTPPAPVTITIAPLAWRAANLEGAPSLLAVRRVTTPDGQLTQGLVVSSERLRTWVEERDPAVTAALVTSRDRPTLGATAPVVLADVGWWIVVDDAAALAAARSAAAGLRSQFLGRFIPISILAIACALLVVLLTARAEKLARQRERFAAAAAHELRTPLAGIQLYGDMLVDGLGDPAKHRDYARRVAEEASRLGRVVANVLGFSQLERKSLAVRPDTGDVVEAVRAAVERAEPGLIRAGAAIELDAPESAKARFDRDALARILGNLLDNAEKYTRDHEDRHITIAVQAVDKAVEITVADRGPGLPASLRRRRFEPFARGIGDDGPPGLGLGLALSQSLAQAMGGELTWKDQSSGATFVVRLPAD
jgi:signal transduction histidine kinase